MNGCISLFELVSRTGDLPVTVDEVAYHMRLDYSPAEITEESGYITSLIDSACRVAEHYMNRTVQETTFNGYLDSLITANYFIKKSPLISVSSIETRLNDAWTTVDTDSYGISYHGDYKTLFLNSGYSWPSTDAIPNAVKLVLSAGYTEITIPLDIKQAILMHVAAMHVNRGDVQIGAPSAIESVPEQSLTIYHQNKIFQQ